MKELIAWFDRTQQRWPPTAFAWAVVRKYGDDGAGRAAALVAYYAFFSVFPLLLVLVTVLGLVLEGNPQLQQDILDSAFAQIPVIGTQLRDQIGTLGASGVALAVGLIGTFYGARGMADAMQEAGNQVWNVPLVQRPGFPWSILRSFGLTVVVGVGLMGTTFVVTLATSTLDLGSASRILAFVGSAALNVLVFAGGFRLATSKVVPMRQLWLAAVLAAAAWQVLQLLGGLLVTRVLANASDVYGVFATVIGLLTWFALGAQATLWSLEVAVVRARRMWPRTLTDQLTDADREALRIYAQVQQRRDTEVIEVRFEPASGSGGTPDDGADADAEPRTAG